MSLFSLAREERVLTEERVVRFRFLSSRPFFAHPSAFVLPTANRLTVTPLFMGQLSSLRHASPLLHIYSSLRRVHSAVPPMVSFSMVHLRALRSRLQLLSVSARIPSPHSCPRISRPSVVSRLSTLPPSYCRRISNSARASQGPLSSSETRIPVLPLVTGTRRRAGAFVAAQKIAKATNGARVETPKISKYRVDCNSPKVIKRKKKPAALQEAGTASRSTFASVSASAPAPKQDPAPALKPTRKTSKKKAKQAAATAKKVLINAQPLATDILGAEMATGASGVDVTKEPTPAPSTPPTATTRKNVLAGLPRPPTFTEPPLGIGSDVLFTTMANVSNGPTSTIGASSTSTWRVLEREKANWPSQPPPKVGRTVYRTILDWSIHPTVQPGDFGSTVPLPPPPLSSFQIMTKGGRKPIPPSVSSFVQSITNAQSPASTPSTATTTIDSGFTATGTRSRRRIGFEALDDTEELERQGSSRSNTRSNSRSNSRANSKSNSRSNFREVDTQSGSRSSSGSNSNIDRPRVQETRNLSRATDNGNQDAEIVKDPPKQESDTPPRPASRHRRIGFDSLEEDSKAPPKNAIKRSSSRFSF